jgi:hypothetical protein
MSPIGAQEREAFERDLHAFQVAGIFSFLTLFGVYVVAGAAFSTANGWKEQTFVGLIWALACLLFGVGAGFLFAIPRVQQANGLPQRRSENGYRRAVLRGRCQS